MGNKERADEKRMKLMRKHWISEEKVEAAEKKQQLTKHQLLPPIQVQSGLKYMQEVKQSFVLDPSSICFLAHRHQLTGMRWEKVATKVLRSSQGWDVCGMGWTGRMGTKPLSNWQNLPGSVADQTKGYSRQVYNFNTGSDIFEKCESCWRLATTKENRMLWSPTNMCLIFFLLLLHL